MKYTFLHKSTSIALALLVMVSTLSFTVEKHFCGTTLVDVAVFTEVKTCGMEMPSSNEVTKKSCCKNEVDLVKGQDELKMAFSDLDSEQQQFIAVFVLMQYNLLCVLSEGKRHYKKYSPPDLVADIQLLDEVFLI